MGAKKTYHLAYVPVIWSFSFRVKFKGILAIKVKESSEKIVPLSESSLILDKFYLCGSNCKHFNTYFEQ